MKTLVFVSIIGLLPFVALQCAGKNSLYSSKAVSYPIDAITKRADIVNQSIFAMAGFGFTTEYANAADNFSAVRSEWRLQEQFLVDDPDGAPVMMRDRALLHLTPRGTSGAQAERVASRIEFQVQINNGADDKWLAVEPFPVHKEEYLKIISDLKIRLNRLGYRF